MNARTLSAALVALVLSVTTTACKQGGETSASCPELTTASLTIIKDVTANAPTAVPTEVECMVTQAFREGKPVSVISADGVPTVTRSEWVAPVRTDNDTVFNDDLPGAFTTLRQSFIPADDPGLDLLKAFSLAEDLGADSTVVVLSSGLQDQQPLSFPAQGLLAADPQELADAVVATGALSSAGGISDVIWLGAGYGVGTQRPLTDREIDQVRSIWGAVLGKVGVANVSFEGAPPSKGNAVTTAEQMTPTPSNPVVGPSFAAEPPAPSKPKVFVYDGSTSVTFVKDKATFIDPAAAQQDLASLASYIAQAGSCGIEVDGTTAEIVGITHDQGRQLALARANAVRDALAALGVDATCMTTTGYPGSESPFYQENYPSGTFDPVAAANNRAVHVTVAAP
jgi:OmpA-OmpF porin, OOP family